MSTVDIVTYYSLLFSDVSAERLKLMLQTHTDIQVQEEHQLALYITIDAHKK